MLIVHAQEGGAFDSVAIKARPERPALATLKRPADGPRAFRVEQSCRLLRYSAGNGQPMHQAALRQVVVNDGLVLHRAVDPGDDASDCCDREYQFAVPHQRISAARVVWVACKFSKKFSEHDEHNPDQRAPFPRDAKAAYPLKHPTIIAWRNQLIAGHRVVGDTFATDD